MNILHRHHIFAKATCETAQTISHFIKTDITLHYPYLSITVFLIALITIISCKQVSKKENKRSQSNSFVATRIKIAELPNLLYHLQKRQLEYDFFGITSNDVDCIYFIPTADHFDIEFEVMSEDQKPYLQELRLYADQHHWKTSDTTYNNKPIYNSAESAPVLHIHTNASNSEMALIGKKLMADLFSNNDATTYDVVP